MTIRPDVPCLRIVLVSFLCLSFAASAELLTAHANFSGGGDETNPVSSETAEAPIPKDQYPIASKRFIVDPPTLENLGFRWYIEGDSNRNASVSVAFRKNGETTWEQALPMLRVHNELTNQKYGPYQVGNLFAGSVLFLESATAYQVRFTMSDPDGGAPLEPRIVTVSTRAEPAAFAGGRKIEATPEKGLMAAYGEAKPGDVILLRPGVYRGPFNLEKSGTEEKPIVFRGPPGGEAVLACDGVGGKARIVTLNGTHHVYFERLTFRNAHTAVYAAKPGGSEGLVVRGCRIYNVVYGINRVVRIPKTGTLPIMTS